MYSEIFDILPATWPAVMGCHFSTYIVHTHFLRNSRAAAFPRMIFIVNCDYDSSFQQNFIIAANLNSTHTKSLFCKILLQLGDIFTTYNIRYSLMKILWLWLE